MIKEEDDNTNNGYSSDSNHGSSETSRQYARVNRVQLPKNSDEYKRRRERNNQAVKKSRNKSKKATLETQARVIKLRGENEELAKKIEILSKELGLLKEILRAHVTGNMLNKINQDELRDKISSDTFRSLFEPKSELTDY